MIWVLKHRGVQENEEGLIEKGANSSFILDWFGSHIYKYEVKFKENMIERAKLWKQLTCLMH